MISLFDVLQKGSSSPTWNESFTVDITDANAISSIRVQVFAEDPDATENREVGNVELSPLDLSLVVQQGTLQQDSQMRVRGSHLRRCLPWTHLTS